MPAARYGRIRGRGLCADRHRPRGGAARIGVRLARAEQGLQTRTIRTVGRVEADESRIHHVHQVEGWVRRVYVATTGQTVRAGQPLLPYIARSSSPPGRSTSPRAGSARAAGRPPNPPAAASSSLVSTRSRSARSKPPPRRPPKWISRRTAAAWWSRSASSTACASCPARSSTIADLSQVWSRPRCTSTSCCWSRRARRRP